MRYFTIIQNVLTAIVIPFLAIIVGLSSIPAVYLFFKIISIGGVEASSFTEIDTVSLSDFLFVGTSLGVAIMTWGVVLVIFSGALGGLFRPRLEPGRYPLQSFVTIQWAWSMIFHRIALFFLPYLVPSFIGNTYYRLSGAKLGKGVQINSAHINDAGSVTLGDGVVLGGNATINAHLTEKGELVMAPVKVGDQALLGMGSVVQPGCTIGNGAIVASKAVVPKWTEIPAGEVWGGIPAKCIRRADGTRPK